MLMTEETTRRRMLVLGRLVLHMQTLGPYLIGSWKCAPHAMVACRDLPGFCTSICRMFLCDTYIVTAWSLTGLRKLEHGGDDSVTRLANAKRIA